ASGADDRKPVGRDRTAPVASHLTLIHLKSTPMDKPIEEQPSWVPAPVWIVVHGGGVTTDEGDGQTLTNEGAPVYLAGDRHRALVAFTGRDLAQRCIDGVEEAGFVPFGFERPEDFAAYLLQRQRQGWTHVAFDP